MIQYSRGFYDKRAPSEIPIIFYRTPVGVDPVCDSRIDMGIGGVCLSVGTKELEKA